MTPYKYYAQRPARLTPEFVQSESAPFLETLAAADAAPDASAWLDAVSRWNALRGYLEGERSRLGYALSKNCLDEALEAQDRYFREQIQPAQEEGDARFLRALAKSPHRPAIAARHGAYFLDRMAAGQPTVDPVNSALRVQVGELGQQHSKAIASAEVLVAGEKMTLTRAASIAGGAGDTVLRREAYLAYRGWFDAHRAMLGELFANMVRMRDEMGRNLGHANFIALGYAGMQRTDYGPAESAQFRRGVRESFVPLNRRLIARQAAEMGGERLKPWDMGYHTSLGIPLGAVPVEGQLDAAQRVFAKLSPRLASHYERMRGDGLIDLANRKGKRGGAFCTTFPDEGRVAIFCNSTGQADDVRTLMHEMGHAFQASESQAIELVELQWPTADAAEIHSMGMEFLSLKHVQEFFADEEHARRFRKKLWVGAVELICYICVVDEFQHWVYENPGATPAERDAQWDRSWETYIPGLDFGGIEPMRSARWYAQTHIFRMPFYYIDYAIAELGAMQLALMDKTDPARTLETYLELCRIGGTQGVLDIFRSAGLRSPFDAGVMAELAAHAAKECGLA
ncbi:M3 family oligoendopeptidase [Caenimonas aquaedulcis]|uniref:M3 family oligoendopeptidase n=1 Tax=Caenimonas aquaedulcis TaxID=2793270 RepID=A0A931H8C4_9BURK|nr:M3 family oligoendopeptidase [Caenimonas aquaedulcis]MBG9390262.1 M3 family oligoendopeptidase [Caenimonas aquaedulcis]